ncbi:hypothetical protein, partial [Microcoleus anatoxicus]|uniref:hypothetical protein n=1 Tax=Microcoleus anatoxicus TaxID=2705319 RepID=UPI0030C960C6
EVLVSNFKLMSLAYCVLGHPFLPIIIVNNSLDLHKLYIFTTNQASQELLLASPHPTRQGVGVCRRSGIVNVF